jgi:hypothetical protein
MVLELPLSTFFLHGFWAGGLVRDFGLESGGMLNG